eukprot:16434863-Heterocapsa_arctica.AAC.1
MQSDEVTRWGQSPGDFFGRLVCPVVAYPVLVWDTFGPGLLECLEECPPQVSVQAVKELGPISLFSTRSAAIDHVCAVAHYLESGDSVFRGPNCGIELCPGHCLSAWGLAVDVPPLAVGPFPSYGP